MINRTRSGHVLLSAGIGALLLLHATSPAHAQGGAALAGPAGTQFEVQVLIGSQEFDEDFAAAAGAEVRTAMAEVSVATAVARGTAGSGRLLANIDADSTFSTQAAGSLRWQDLITPSGADTYRFEFELVGDVMVGDLPTDAFPGSTDAAYAVGLDLSGERSFITVIYQAKAAADSCSPGTLPAAGGCLEIQSENAQIPFEVSGTGDLSEGPVVIAFTPPHPMSGSWDAQFSLVARNSYSCCAIGPIPMGPVLTSIDLGTGGNYARFLGVTSATTGGMPDTDFAIASATGYDYSQPATLVQALPEPGSSLALGCALASLLGLRRVRARG